MPRLDVIVPCYGQHALTLRFLHSFAVHAPEWARLILIDNARGLPAGTVPTGGRVLEDTITISNSQNLGFIRAVNMGICASDAEYICIQNNDTEIFEGCYERLIADLEANPDVALMSPVASDKGSAWLSLDVLRERWGWYAPEIPEHAECSEDHAARAHWLITHPTDRWPVRNGVHRPSMVPFFCTMMPRATIDRFGLLDTRFGMGLGDDDDYCLRVRAGGMECGLSLGTYVYHVGRATFDAEHSRDEMATREAEARSILNEKWGVRA